MSTLNAQPRDTHAKGKQLRRDGFIPAVLFGKHLEESVLIQVAKADAEQFLRTNTVGSKLDLVIGGKKHLALLKDISFAPVAGTVEHLGFQAITKGEKVASEFHIHLHNRAKVDGIVQQLLSQVHYRADPADLIDTVEVDLEGKVVNDSAILSDFEFAHNPKLEILTPLDSPVYSISPKVHMKAEPSAQAESGETAAEETAEAEKEES